MAATIGTLSLEPIAALAVVPGQKAIVKESERSPVARTSETYETKMSAKDLEERGTKPRAELETIFERLLNSGKLNRQIDITSSIAPYISGGMTFEESESILRAAGFTVYPHPDARKAQDPNRARDWYSVYAEIPNFSRRIFGSVTVAVSLLPESPGDYSKIKNVSATLFLSQL